MFFVYLLGSFTLSFNGFKGASSAPCGRVAKAPFAACLRSDVGGVWPFRIRCRRASFFSRLRDVFGPHGALIYFSFKGFKGALPARCGRVASAPFLGCLSSELGGVWLFRIRCRRASFLSWLRDVVGAPTGALIYYSTSLLRVSKVPLRPGVEGLHFGCCGLGFRWCLAVSHPLPTSFIFVFVQARLRYGFCPATAAIYFSLDGFKGALSAPAWLFRIHCRRASFNCLCPG